MASKAIASVSVCDTPKVSTVSVCVRPSASMFVSVNVVEPVSVLVKAVFAFVFVSDAVSVFVSLSEEVP